MDRFDRMNPFAKRDSHSRQAVITYKVLTIVTWLASVLTTLFYDSDRAPGHVPIWGHNYGRYTGFTMNSVIVQLYWLALFVFQLGYILHLFAGNMDRQNAACSVGSHFVANNLLHVAWVALFVRGHYVAAELLLIINFFNLSSLYFRHNAHPRLVHVPTVSGPLAWTFVAIYWNGALMVYHPHSLPARIVANVFIWSILVYGLFFVGVYRDYSMGFALSILSAAIGVAQFLRQVVALQWIFAFVIMAVLFVLSLGVAIPAWTGRDLQWGRTEPEPDQERAPLLAE